MRKWKKIVLLKENREDDCWLRHCMHEIQYQIGSSRTTFFWSVSDNSIVITKEGEFESWKLWKVSTLQTFWHKLWSIFPRNTSFQVWMNLENQWLKGRLVTLFVFFGNTCGCKKCVKIPVMFFKNWKHVFKHMYQTNP